MSIPKENLPMLERLKKLIEKHNSFILTTHINPDGDGIGSEIALKEFLRQQGKKCIILNNEKVPPRYQFLDPEREIFVYSTHLPFNPKEWRVLLGVDTHDMARLGAMQFFWKDFVGEKYFFDHHVTSQHVKTEYFIDETSASMGALVYELIQHCRGTITKKMAEAIYVAIYSDTGSFNYDNTTDWIHEIAAELLRLGVSPSKINNQVSRHFTLEKLKYLGEVLQVVKTECHGQLAWAEISQAGLKAHGLTLTDVDSFINNILDLKEVKVALLFIENEDGKMKISLRSKGEKDVYPTAVQLGGGGHHYASGALIDGSFQQAQQKVLPLVKALF